MISSILIMSAVAALLTLTLLLLRPFLSKRISASARALAWCVVLAASLIPIRLTLPQTTVAATIPTMREAVEGFVAPVIVTTPPSASGQSAKAVDITIIILLVWSVGAVAFLLWSIVSYFLMSRKLRVTRIPAINRDIAVLETFPHKATLYRSKFVPTPMLLGVIIPRIYLPEREYSDAALRNILTHELAHYRRRDIIVKWLALIANAIHWFNPALYLLRRELERECELAADEAVIRQLDDDARISYGNFLLDVAAKEKISISSMALCSKAYALKDRIEAIVKYQKKKWPSVVLSGVLLAVIAATAIACTAARAQNSTTDIFDEYAEYEIAASAPPEDTGYNVVKLITYNGADRDIDEVTCNVGESFRLMVEVMRLDGDYGTRNRSFPISPMMESSDESVFTINKATGVITAVGPGTALCSVPFEYIVSVEERDFATAECIINVVELDESR